MSSKLYTPLPPLPSTDLYTFLFHQHSPYSSPQHDSLPVLTEHYPTGDPPPLPTTPISLTFQELKSRAELCGRMLVNPRWGFDFAKEEVMGMLGWNGVGFGEHIVPDAVNGGC